MKKKINWNTVINVFTDIVMIACVGTMFVMTSINPIEQQTIQQNTENTYECTHEPCQCTTEEEQDFIADSVKTEGHFEYSLCVPVIAQNPELPTGCEVTSLTMVLRYLGYDVDKLTLADEFLPKGEIGKTHPDVAFIGNPRDEHSYGANAPVLVKTANEYLNSVNAKHDAYWITSSDVEDLMEYIHNGYPVMIWVTRDMEDGYYSTKWTIDEVEVQWYAREHCMVLIGYTNRYYVLADPLSGEYCYYEKTLVEQRYDELKNQALVVY